MDSVTKGEMFSKILITVDEYRMVAVTTIANKHAMNPFAQNFASADRANGRQAAEQ